MSLPWNTDKDVNIFTNEYNQQLTINRALSRLLDNDQWLMSFWSDQSLSGAGYQKFPNGLVLQWGHASTGGNGIKEVITLPVAFPTTCLHVLATASEPDEWGPEEAGVGIPTIFTAKPDDTSAQTLSTQFIMSAVKLTTAGVPQWNSDVECTFLAIGY